MVYIKIVVWVKWAYMIGLHSVRMTKKPVRLVTTIMTPKAQTQRTKKPDISVSR